MTCQQWRAIHPSDASRYRRAYEVVDKFPNMSLETALSLVASGKDPAEYLAEKAKPSPRKLVHAARRAVSNAAIEAYFRRLIAGRMQVSVTLLSKTFADVLVGDRPTELQFANAGPVKKIEVVSMVEQAAVDRYPPAKVDAAIAAKVQPGPRTPDARPVSDPRPLVPLVGKVVEAALRNGVTYRLPLAGVGPFDLLLGESGREVFVPLHALLSWQPAA